MFCQIRDPVHNFIPLEEHECKIVDTRVLQRLRSIRQLAMAYMVYPGAVHTRFDHTLGVCHVAGLMADQLRLHSEKRLLRLAALLHDIGHGPFSHVSEQPLDRYADRAALGDKVKKTEKIHERLTQDLIEHDEELGRVISNDERGQIMKLLSDGYGEPVVRSIVSGPLDADKQDYLLRDSLFCGVRYGVFDLSQILRSLVVGKDRNADCLMIDPDGIHALEQFILAKYYLTTQVYRHRVRLITDQMLSRAITLGIDLDGIDELRKLYHYDGSTDFIRRYLEWDDARFLLTFGNKKKYGKTRCYELIERLTSRRLLKLVFECEVGKSISSRAARKAILDMDDARAKEIEKRIAEILSTAWGTSVDENFVILNKHTIKSVKLESRNDEASILMDTPQKPTPFEQSSSLFASIRERSGDIYIHVYAPAEYANSADKRRLMDGVREPIRGLLESLEPIKEEEEA